MVGGLVHGRPAKGLAVVLVGVLVGALGGLGVGIATPGSGVAGTARVIVQEQAGAAGGPRRAVAQLGGRVTQALPIVAGFAATVPAAAIPSLARTPGVRAVTPDHQVHVQAATSEGKIRSVYPQVVRASDLWKQKVTGSGVTVAIVDTGVAEVPDLAGRLVPVTDDLTGQTTPCKNLSGETDCADAYGHGTFVAGLIAGSGASSGGKWKGVAPGARVLSVKIAGRDGAADVSNVLGALQWVVSFKDRYGIRVLNLSLGTDSTQTYLHDPLNYAVERAWAAGIAVVVSAANEGPDPRTITKPGDDPFVITVGASDDRGTVGLSDDVLPDFSSRGPTAADGLAKPDLVAPGAHLVSLRAPGSAVDTQFPDYVDGSYRQGSGTSMATGVVSGLVALMLQTNPTMGPDRVKFALRATARNAASDDPMAVGAGTADAYSAALSAPPGQANQGLLRSDGMGSLGGSRGGIQVQTDDPAGTVLGPVVNATLTAQLLCWNPLGYTTSGWLGADWYVSTWEVNRFYRVSWYGTDWPGNKWRGSSWYGQPDTTSSYGSPWHGSASYGAWE